METEAESHWIMLLELILCRISGIGYICGTNPLNDLYYTLT